MNRIGLCALLAVLNLAACSKGTNPPPSDNKTTPPPASAQVEGLPQITLTPDSVHIDYRVWGKGEPAVVLIHGWACDAAYWTAQIDALKSKYTVVAVNLAGHGGSERNRTDWSIANYGED